MCCLVSLVGHRQLCYSRLTASVKAGKGVPLGAVPRYAEVAGGTPLSAQKLQLRHEDKGNKHPFSSICRFMRRTLADMVRSRRGAQAEAD